MNLASSETRINLMRAFAGESQARNRYNMASSAARKEGYHFISKIFDFTACQEQAHATVFYGFLKELNDVNFDICAAYPINCFDTTEKHLKAAVNNEYDEYNSAYRSFAETAKQEGFNQISSAFTMIGEVEKIHAERFDKILKMLNDGSIFKSENSGLWVCTNCGHIHSGVSAPTSCPVCSHPQGYFVNDCFKTETTILI